MGMNEPLNGPVDFFAAKKKIMLRENKISEFLKDKKRVWLRVIKHASEQSDKTEN